MFRESQEVSIDRYYLIAWPYLTKFWAVLCLWQLSCEVKLLHHLLSLYRGEIALHPNLTSKEDFTRCSGRVGPALSTKNDPLKFGARYCLWSFQSVSFFSQPRTHQPGLVCHFLKGHAYAMIHLCLC